MKALFLLSVAAVAAFLLATYNRLVKLRNQVDNAFATIDVQLRQRSDLVPNVVAAVRGYFDHERSLLERLVALRREIMGEGLSPTQRFAAGSEIGELLKQVQVRIEGYPALRASENVEQLQRTLNEAEAQIAAARRTYNAEVTELNTAIDLFPTNVVAGLLGFSSRPLFVAGEAERVPAEVDTTEAR